jgi:hypothetical protein
VVGDREREERRKGKGEEGGRRGRRPLPTPPNLSPF